MTSSWKAVLGTTLIFILGCLAGWVGASLFHYHQTTLFLQRGPDAVADLLERRMTRNLDLTSDQKAQIHQYFLENLRQRKELQKQIQPQVQVLNRQTMQELATVLNADQMEHLKQNMTAFRQRFGKSAFNPTADSPPAISAGPMTNAGQTVPPVQ